MTVLTAKNHSPSSKNQKTRSARALLVLVLAGAIGLATASCTLSSEKLEFERAEKEAQSKDFEAALKHYKVIVDRYVKSDYAIRAAKEAARISQYETRKFQDAVEFNKHLVLYAPKTQDRNDAQKRIAELYFNNIQDYSQAVIEFNRLLELPHTPEEELHYRISIARSYFYLGNFFQSEVEIDQLLKRDFKAPQVFDALLLKANIYLTTKRIDDAIEVLKALLEKYPERSREETIGLVLAVCYEEQKNFAKAIETLQSIKDHYPRKAFIEKRIKALRERQTLLPGARGFRK
jgi:tetratricopeptide (TPR) repeat protein